MYCSPAATIASLSLFAPSEMAFLHGDELAGKGGLLDGVHLLHTPTRLAGPQLVPLIYAAAILANEEVETIRLVEHESHEDRSVWNELYVADGPAAVNWPGQSIERRLCAMLSPQPIRVFELLYNLLAADRDNPWQQAVDVVAEGLAERGLAEKQTVHHLFFSTERLALSERTRNRVALQSLDRVRDLLRTCQETRPAVWQMLIRDIRRGVERRRPGVRNSEAA